MRPEVRHCRDCTRLKDGRREGTSRGVWQCWHPLFQVISPTGYHVITGQEIRTCPKWCPIEDALKKVRDNAKTQREVQAWDDDLPE